MLTSCCMGWLGYVGPGAGLGLGGALLGVLLALLTAVAFMLVWPLRMLYRKLRGVQPVPERLELDGNATAAPLNSEQTATH